MSQLQTATGVRASGRLVRSDGRNAAVSVAHRARICLLPQRNSIHKPAAGSSGQCRAMPHTAGLLSADLLSTAPLAQLPFPLGLPGFDFFTVAGFLLNNPVITVALAVGFYVVLPRVWRWVLKRVLLPAGILLVVLFAAQHPSQSVLLGKSVLACKPCSDRDVDPQL